jgi:hypothetical protein
VSNPGRAFWQSKEFLMIVLMKKITVGIISCLCLSGCGSTVLELSEFSKIKKSLPNGYIHVSLIGEYKKYKKDGVDYEEKSSPYYLLLRYVASDKNPEMKEIMAERISIKSAETGAEHFFYKGRIVKVLKQDSHGDYYAGFLFEGLNLPYEDSDITFVLKEGGLPSNNVRVKLIKQYSKKRVNNWLEGIKGI